MLDILRGRNNREKKKTLIIALPLVLSRLKVELFFHAVEDLQD